jgi:hypothetical protein
VSKLSQVLMAEFYGAQKAEILDVAPTKEEILGELRAYGMLSHHEAKFKALELAERIRKYGINLGESQDVKQDGR